MYIHFGSKKKLVRFSNIPRVQKTKRDACGHTRGIKRAIFVCVFKIIIDLRPRPQGH